MSFSPPRQPHTLPCRDTPTISIILPWADGPFAHHMTIILGLTLPQACMSGSLSCSWVLLSTSWLISGFFLSQRPVLVNYSVPHPMWDHFHGLDVFSSYIRTLLTYNIVKSLYTCWFDRLIYSKMITSTVLTPSLHIITICSCGENM